MILSAGKRKRGWPLFTRMIYLMFPELSNVVYILAVIAATSCSAERSFSALRRLKTYPHSTVDSNDIDRIIVIFGHRNGRDRYFFQLVL